MKTLLKLQMEKLLRQWGWEISRLKTPHVVDLLSYHHVNTIRDVGANIGQYGVRLRNIGYKERIVSFEPHKATYQEL